jgi:hypothetical protein
MSERHYYLRSETENGYKGKIYGVVVVSMNDDGTVNRGVSVCSYKDKFNKTIALNIARGRFAKAVNIKESIPFREYNGEVNKKMNPVLGSFDMASYHAEANELEKKMFRI